MAWEGRGFDGPRHGQIIYPGAMTRDAIMAELLEIEGLLQDDRLNDDDRHALHGAQQALLNILDPETWHKPIRHSTGLTISRAKPFPCFCTSYGGLPLNAALAGRLGISALDDDGRGHPCGARVYGFCIPSKQERAGQRRVGPGPGIHPNRTAKGYAGIRVRIGGEASEGEGASALSGASPWTEPPVQNPPSAQLERYR